MRFIRHRRRQAPAVIIVALIDLLIVLLIFVMVTTTFKHQQNAIQITLPESRNASKSEDVTPAILTIQVTPQPPHLHIEGRPVTHEKIQNELARVVDENPNTIVFIQADEMAPFGQVVKVRDAAKDANIKNVQAMTRRAKE